MRQGTRAVFGVMVSVLAFVAPGAGPAAAEPVVAAATTAVSVTPDTGLVDGQTVTVSGTGYDGLGTPIGVLQCLGGGAFNLSNCGGTVQFPAVTDGAWSISLRVQRYLSIGSTPTDCAAAPGTCVVVGAPASDFTQTASAPIAFDPNPPPPAVAASAEPATGLVDGQQVTVTASGFLPRAPYQVSECLLLGDQPCRGLAYGQFADDGTLSVPVTIGALIVDHLGITRSCPEIGCRIEVRDPGASGYVADVGIGFDPTGPPPRRPTITVDPAVDLAASQVVRVTGTNFPADALLTRRLCLRDTSTCAYLPGPVQADEAGAFDASVTVRRFVPDYAHPDTDGNPGKADCAPDRCDLVVSAYDPYGEDVVAGAAAEVAFDPGAPVPDPPTATVTPDHDLPYAATVTVDAHGFIPGADVEASFCIQTPTKGFCAGYDFQTADTDGDAILHVPVQRAIPTAGLDCANPDTVCRIRVTDADRIDVVDHDLTFDPTAPPPPPPTVTVTPDHDLGWRQTVTVHAEGLTPGALAGVSECPAGVSVPPITSQCFGGLNPQSVDADGTFTTTLEVRRILTDGMSPPIDCATAAAPCTVQLFSLSSFGQRTGAAPLQFDPDSVAPPPPGLTVEPTTGLTDGRSVHVTGNGWSPNTSLAVSLCVAGTQLTSDCSPDALRYVVSDASGAFATDVVVTGHYTRFGGGDVDCTTGPGACAIGAANLGDLLEHAFVPVTFGTVGTGPDLELHSASVREGTGGTTTALLPVELADPAPGPVVVQWRADPGSAGPQDLAATTGSVTIAAGATDAVLPVPVAADALDEPTERFTVTITSVSGAVVTDGSATVKIRDDDDEPDVNVGDWHASEGAGVAFTLVGLSTPSGRTVTVEWKTHHDSARSGRDFERTTGEITFAPGQQWALVTVPLVDDAVREPTERFRIELRDADDAGIGDGDAWIIVTDDD